MRFTTSRRPSPGTRRLARILASFFGSEYMTRGKSSLDDEGEVWIVVVEEHGNPSGLARRHCGEEKDLRFALSVEGESKRLKMKRPVVVGTGKAARDLAEFFGLDWAPESAAVRVIRVGDELIDFVDGEDLILRLKI
jgi:rRNA maturation protein Rpf1